MNKARWKGLEDYHLLEKDPCPFVFGQEVNMKERATIASEHRMRLCRDSKGMYLLVD